MTLDGHLVTATQWPRHPPHWVPRPLARNVLTWRARCPHGAVGDWTAAPTEDLLRIATTCACPCEAATRTRAAALAWVLVAARAVYVACLLVAFIPTIANALTGGL